MAVVLDWACPGQLTIAGETVFIGNITGSLIPTGPNILFGSNALQSATTGSNNIAIGSNALQALTTGNNNVAVGYNNTTALTVGNNNIIVGTGSFQNNTNGNNNISVGYTNLNNTSGNSNISVGNNNVAVGDNSLSIGNNNVVPDNAIYISNTGMPNMWSSVFVSGLRSASNVNLLYYNPTTKEVTYSGGSGTAGLLFATNNDNQIILGNLTLNSPNTGNDRTYNIPDLGNISADFVLDTGNQTIDGNKNFPNGVINQTNNIYVNSISNNVQLICNATNVALPNTSSGVFLLKDYVQDISGFYTFNNLIAEDGLSLATKTLIVDGIQTTNKTFTIPNSGNDTFLLSAGAQTIANKTLDIFRSSLANNQLRIGTQLTINSSIAARTYTIPPEPSGNFILTSGNQNITGNKTLTAGLNIATLTFNGGIDMTTTQPGPKTYTIPTVNTDASFVMNNGNQTISNTKNFTTITSGNNSLTLGSGIINTASTTGQTYTLPNTTGSFVLTSGNTTFTGSKTFSTLAFNNLTINGNNINLINVTTNRIYTIPNTTNSDFVTTFGNQLIDGIKTFNGGIKIQNSLPIYQIRFTFYGNIKPNGLSQRNTMIGLNALAGSVFPGYNANVDSMVSIGANSGVLTDPNNTTSNMIVIGANAKTDISETIVINAASVAITAPTTTGFYAKPIAATPSNNIQQLSYDTSNNEIVYNTSKVFGSTSTLKYGSVFISAYNNLINRINFNYTYGYLPTISTGLELDTTINVDSTQTYRNQIITTRATSYFNFGVSVSNRSQSVTSSFPGGTITYLTLNKNPNSNGIQIACTGGGGLFYQYTFDNTYSSISWNPLAQKNTFLINGPIRLISNNLNRPITLFNVSTAGLMYSYSSNTYGGGSWLPYTISTTSFTVYNMGKLSNGNLYIYYQNANLFQYLSSVNSNPTNLTQWNTVYTISATPETIAQADTVTAVANNGCPCFLYTNGSDINIRYASVTNPTQPSDWNKITIYFGGLIGTTVNSLNLTLLADGTLATAWIANSATTSTIIYGTSVNNGAAWNLATIFSTPIATPYTQLSLAVGPNGYASITYYRGGSSYYLNALNNIDWNTTPILVRTETTSLLTASFRPIIANNSFRFPFYIYANGANINMVYGTTYKLNYISF